MIQGLALGVEGLLLLGVAIFLLLLFQVLVGQRVIRFKGRTHAKVHRIAAWILLALAAVHGLAATAIFLG